MGTMAEAITKHFNKKLKLPKNTVRDHTTTKIATDSQDKTLRVDDKVSLKTIPVDSDTHSPSKAWQRVKKGLEIRTKQPIDVHTSIAKDKVRFVCISDTHTRVEEIEGFTVPHGDVLLHAGDFTLSGRPPEVGIFNKFLGRLPHKHKIVIAGNHDVCMDDDYIAGIDGRFGAERREDLMMRKYKVRHPKDMLTNCIYLQDEMMEIAGIKIYGSPWQPSFGSWGFQLDRGRQLLQKWNIIPDDVDVLMTHGPPLGMGDRLNSGRHVGCVELLNTVLLRVKPKFHVFGHIHEGYGMCTDGTTTFINASTVTLKYRPINPPVVFDIDLPLGKSKDDVVLSVKSNDDPVLLSSEGS